MVVKRVLLYAALVAVVLASGQGITMVPDADYQTTVLLRPSPFPSPKKETYGNCCGDFVRRHKRAIGWGTVLTIGAVTVTVTTLGALWGCGYCNPQNTSDQFDDTTETVPQPWTYAWRATAHTATRAAKPLLEWCTTLSWDRLVSLKDNPPYLLTPEQQAAIKSAFDLGQRELKKKWQDHNEETRSNLQKAVTCGSLVQHASQLLSGLRNWWVR